jgi:hypothetical protein
MMNRHPAFPTPWMLATERRVEDAEAAAETNARALKRIAAKAIEDLKTLSFDDAEPIPGHDLVDLIAVLELAAGIDPRKYGTVVGDIVRDRECENV